MSGHITFHTEREVDKYLYREGTSCLQLTHASSSTLMLAPLYLVISAIVLTPFATQIVPTRGALISGSVFAGVGIVASPMTLFGVYSIYKYRNVPMGHNQLRLKLLSERDKGNPYLRVKPAPTAINQLATDCNVQL